MSGICIIMIQFAAHDLEANSLEINGHRGSDKKEAKLWTTSSSSSTTSSIFLLYSTFSSMSSTVTQTQSSSKIDKGKGKQKETASSSASASLSLSSKVQHDNPAYNSNWIQQAVHSDFHQNIFSFEDFVKNEVKVKLDHGKYKD